MKLPEHYDSGIAIHRHALKRGDSNWLTNRQIAPATRYLVLNKGKYPVDERNHIQLLSLTEVEALASSPDCYYLGEINSTEHQCDIFCTQPEQISENNLVWRTLRRTHDDDNLTRLALHAQGLLNWHASCKYCEKCGSQLTTATDGHSKHCSNDACGNEIFPRINPAVIVLVTHEDRCLLANAHRFKGDIPMYSCLAGYMETGESFEETLQREVMEEVGVELVDCNYLGNQPWPFPHSFMIGFHARARTTDLTYHDGEIKHARWFTATELQTALQNGEILLPTPKSIAFHLLDVWLQQTVSIRLADLIKHG